MATPGEQRSPHQGRPPKRARVTITRGHSQSPQEVAGGSDTTPRTRNATACEKCRARKTRCDNRRPCGYCAKHQLVCVYDDNDATSTPLVTGEQILEAIGSLTDLVKKQNHQHTLNCRCIGRDGQTGSVNYEERSHPPDFSHHHQHNGSSRNGDASPTETGFVSSPRPPLLQSQGVESILSWEILSPYRPSSCTFGGSNIDESYSSQIPNIDYRELTRLESKYIVGVHLKNPILDLADLNRKILQVGENGLDWSTRTCLVTLVCAIGAITQRYRDPDNICITSPSPGIVRSSIGYVSETELSMQFWGIAARRLGFAIGRNDVESVQCLCLAGIWYMHRLEPLQAWKYFNLAGAAWHALNMTDRSSQAWLQQESDSSFTVMQSLYFTIWKSECELKLELDIPGPILDNVEFPLAFPLPPNLSEEDLSPSHAEAERCWYYYLSEIAARHMLNRLVRVHTWNVDVYDERSIRQMIAQADELEIQVQQWYSSLPNIFFFEIPTGYNMEEPRDEMTNILRHRYMKCRELIGRPFVRLCITTSLQINSALRARAATLASQCLRYCVLRIDHVAPQVHQGTWFVLRNAAVVTLILGAADLARRKAWLLGAQDMILPPSWSDRVMNSVEIIGPYWEQATGGAQEMRKMIQAVLDDCMNTD